MEMGCVLCLVMVVGCSDDDTNNGDAGSTDLSANVDQHSGAFPTPPTIGAQIDRMGRAGINTALTDPFFDETSTTATAMHHAKQDQYNQASDPTMWLQFSSEITASLGVFDALDDVCGNQLAFGALNMPAYTTLTTVLTNDELAVFSGTASCTNYLAVEAATLGGSTPTDCGGRTPLENTVDVTFGVLAAFPPPPGITNGITSDATPGISTTAFPYLAPPN
jgi:hypothetical protein